MIIYYPTVIWLQVFLLNANNFQTDLVDSYGVEDGLVCVGNYDVRN